MSLFPFFFSFTDIQVSLGFRQSQSSIDFAVMPQYPISSAGMISGMAFLLVVALVRYPIRRRALKNFRI